MIRTGAIPSVWPWALSYLADVNNHCASRFLRWRTPIEIRYGYTPNISALLLYQIWEQVYYKIDEGTPNIKESKGHWMGISPHVRDILTFYIYCPDTKREVI